MTDCYDDKVQNSPTLFIYTEPDLHQSHLWHQQVGCTDASMYYIEPPEARIQQMPENQTLSFTHSVLQVAVIGHQMSYSFSRPPVMNFTGYSHPYWKEHHDIEPINRPSERRERGGVRMTCFMWCQLRLDSSLGQLRVAGGGERCGLGPGGGETLTWLNREMTEELQQFTQPRLNLSKTLE